MMLRRKISEPFIDFRAPERVVWLSLRNEAYFP